MRAQAVAVGAWQEAHEKLVALAEQRAGLDANEGRWLDVRAKVFSALRNMGYRESEARLGIERASAHVGNETDVATFLKASARRAD